jgi:hypothetical protein
VPPPPFPSTSADYDPSLHYPTEVKQTVYDAQREAEVAAENRAFDELKLFVDLYF